MAASWPSEVKSRTHVGGEPATRKPSGVMLEFRALGWEGVTRVWLCCEPLEMDGAGSFQEDPECDCELLRECDGAKTGAGGGGCEGGARRGGNRAGADAGARWTSAKGLVVGES